MAFTASAFERRLGPHGDSGNDILAGGAGNNTLIGSAGHDSLVGNSAVDILIGGDDNDTLLGGNGNDTLTGGAGNDSLNGGSGTDRLVESADVNLTLTNSSLVGLGTDTLIGIEQASLTGEVSNNTVAVDAIMQEWGRMDAGRPYAQRVAALRAGVGTALGSSGPYTLDPTTVAADAVADVLTGGLGFLDWYFGLAGEIVELEANEQIS